MVGLWNELRSGRDSKPDVMSRSVSRMGLGGGRKNGLRSPSLSCVVYCLSATHSCVSQTRVKAQPRLASSRVCERVNVCGE